MADASHGVDTNAELQIDPSLLRKTSGYLWKKASDSKKWKKRFFVLKHQLRSRNEPYELYYFSKPTDTTPKAIIVLDGAEVVAESRNAKEKVRDGLGLDGAIIVAPFHRANAVSSSPSHPSFPFFSLSPIPFHPSLAECQV